MGKQFIDISLFATMALTLALTQGILWQTPASAGPVANNNTPSPLQSLLMGRPAAEPKFKVPTKTPGQTEEVDAKKMAGADKLVPADLSFQGHGCKIDIPGDYFLNEYAPPIGKLFSFKGPLHPSKDRAVLNLTIMPSPPGTVIPGERAMIDVMLNPYRQSLSKYQEDKEPSFMSGSSNFKGFNFSGVSHDGRATRGFVYLTQVRDTFFIIFASDEMPFADQSLPVLRRSTRACQIGPVK